MNHVATYKQSGSRKDLLNRPAFRLAFDSARERINGMEVQFIEEVNPINQALLEISAALRVEAPYNDFDNH
jgi:hypothetical protein